MVIGRLAAISGPCAQHSAAHGTESNAKTQTTDNPAGCRSQWRRGWDLNPRTPEGQCLSRASHSAALAPLLGEWSIARYRRSWNGGRADECTRLESGRTERFRGFESPPFRQLMVCLAGAIGIPRRGRVPLSRTAPRRSDRCRISFSSLLLAKSFLVTTAAC